MVEWYWLILSAAFAGSIACVMTAIMCGQRYVELKTAVEWYLYARDISQPIVAEGALEELRRALISD